MLGCHHSCRPLVEFRLTLRGKELERREVQGHLLRAAQEKWSRPICQKLTFLMIGYQCWEGKSLWLMILTQVVHTRDLRCFELQIPLNEPGFLHSRMLFQQRRLFVKWLGSPSYVGYREWFWLQPVFRLLLSH